MTSLRLFLRGLLLQAGWNRERMQALGLTFTLLPLAAGRPLEEEKAFVRRHLRYVNTSPALSGVLLGAVAREEERILVEKPSEEEAEARVAAVKRRLEGPLAALGDRTFWGGLRPLAGVIGALALVSFGPGALEQGGDAAARGGAGAGGSARAAMAGIAALLGFYNGPYLAIRIRGTRCGLSAAGQGVAGGSGSFGLGRLNAVLEVVGPLATGALAARLVAFVTGAGQWLDLAGRPAGSPDSIVAAGIALVLSGLLLAAGAARFGQPPERVGMGILALLVLAAGRGG